MRHWSLIVTKARKNALDGTETNTGQADDVARVELLLTNLPEPANEYTIRLLPYQDVGMTGCRLRFEWAKMRASIILLGDPPEGRAWHNVRLPAELEGLKDLVGWTTWSVKSYKGPYCGEETAYGVGAVFDYRLDMTADDVHSPYQEILQVRDRIDRFVRSRGWNPLKPRGGGDTRMTCYRKDRGVLIIELVGGGTRLDPSGTFDELRAVNNSDGSKP